MSPIPIRANKLTGMKVAWYSTIATVIIVIVISVLTVGLGYFGVKTPLSQLGGGTTTTFATSAAGAQGVSCAATQAWSVKQSELAFGGDTLAGTVAINGFTPQSNGQNVGLADLTSTSSPATSTGIYPVSGQIILQYTETSTVTTYPIWASFSASGTVPSSGVVLASFAGLPVLTLGCAPSSSNANANIWNLIATPIQAPTSGTSATTNVKALCIASTGIVLNGGGHASDASFPSSPTLITCNLNLLQPYKGAGYTVTVYGTQQNPVENYATNTVSYSAPQAYSMGALILTNRTGASATLDPSAPPGLTLTPVTTNLLASGTKAWIVTGFTGCSPAPSTAATATPYTCLSLPLDLADSTGGSNHIGVDVIFVDMQQLPYLVSNLVTGAQNTFTLSGSGASTTNTGFSSGLTPTTGPDAGAPAALIKQSYGIVAIG